MSNYPTIGIVLTRPDDYINKVICGDCLDIMQDIPGGAVDCVVTDPPYGIDGATGGQARQDNKEYDGGYFDDTPEYIKSIVIPAVHGGTVLTKKICKEDGCNNPTIGMRHRCIECARIERQESSRLSHRRKRAREKNCVKKIVDYKSSEVE